MGSKSGSDDGSEVVSVLLSVASALLVHVVCVPATDDHSSQRELEDEVFFGAVVQVDGGVGVPDGFESVEHGSSL